MHYFHFLFVQINNIYAIFKSLKYITLESKVIVTKKTMTDISQHNPNRIKGAY